MAGGTALNCVANSRIWRETAFEEVWVQPAAGDAGTALGAALQVHADDGGETAPMTTAALGRQWRDDELAAWLRRAAVPFTTPVDLAGEVADVLAADGVVAWFDGRSEFGPRALGHRSLMAHPGRAANLERLNDVKGREQFRPVAPMVLARAGRGDLPRRTAPEPLHALRAPRRARVARPHPRGRPRRRHGSGADGRRRHDAARRGPAPRLRGPHRAAGRRQHEPQHRRTAHGRRPSGRPGALRLGSGRRAWWSGPHLVRRAALFGTGGAR